MNSQWSSIRYKKRPTKKGRGFYTILFLLSALCIVLFFTGCTAPASGDDPPAPYSHLAGLKINAKTIAIEDLHYFEKDEGSFPYPFESPSPTISLASENIREVSPGHYEISITEAELGSTYPLELNLDLYYAQSEQEGRNMRDFYSHAHNEANRILDLPVAEPVLMGLVDSGLNEEHPSLEGLVAENNNEIPNNGVDDDGNGLVDDVKGWNFVEETNEIGDNEVGSTHGTFIAGIIGGKRYKEGIPFGVNDKVSLIVAKHSKEGNLDMEKTRAAIKYAVDRGARVINFSFSDSGLQEATNYASEKGVIMVASAGNDGRYFEGREPASYPTVIGVGGMLYDYSYADASDYGPYVEYVETMICVSSEGTDGYKLSYGTSFSTPVIGALIARLIGHDSTLDRDSINDLLQTHSIPVEPEGKANYGRINYRSLMEEYIDYETVYIQLHLGDERVILELDIITKDNALLSHKLRYLYTDNKRYSLVERL